MGPTKTIAWLLATYWTVVGSINLLFIEGFGAKSVAEFFAYMVLGVACYILTMKIGNVFSRQRRTKKSEEASRWRS
ncbi:MAG: hypothetical protein HQ553_03055 [Chloroflexi bacterium]|nr:hypothetical protein [Chloroflexota bacterium]